MKKTAKLPALILALTMLAACGGSSGVQPAPEASKAPEQEPEQTAESTEFVPSLDTDGRAELQVAVFFGNFEAFDQVINHFNDYYPNVEITYESIGSNDSDFLINNPSIDIFMTSNAKGYTEESCLDLLSAGVDVSAVGDGLLDSSMEDGRLLALPMGLTLRGFVANKTLLEKEGLSIPRTWQELLDTLEALKQKGYDAPIQGPDSAFAALCYDMGMTMLENDEELREKVASGDAGELGPVYERLLTLMEKGYISPEVNAEYPNDNYDGAIMKFFEGDVPFWVCNTEKVSGMKKRESKSEKFSAEPFEYEFAYVPMGDNGVYEFIEPWYGFAVNKDSDELDYAVEFLRFMAREDELNTLATVKGVPTVAKNAPDDRYASLRSIEKVEETAIYDGAVPYYIGGEIVKAATAVLEGEARTAGEATALFSAQ